MDVLRPKFRALWVFCLLGGACDRVRRQCHWVPDGELYEAGMHEMEHLKDECEGGEGESRMGWLRRAVCDCCVFDSR